MACKPDYSKLFIFALSDIEVQTLLYNFFLFVPFVAQLSIIERLNSLIT